VQTSNQSSGLNKKCIFSWYPLVLNNQQQSQRCIYMQDWRNYLVWGIRPRSYIPAPVEVIWSGSFYCDSLNLQKHRQVCYIS
jgi:hypothetical protein